MHIFKQIDHILPEFKSGIVTIGNFDGIHVGHQQIMKKMVAEAHRENRKAMVMTFDPHPKMVLHPDIQPFYLITTLEEKMSILEKLGMDGVVLFPFNREFAKITAEFFVKDMLWDKLQIKKIFIGHNYRFGNDKRGNDEYLKEFGRRLGFEVEVFDAVTVNGFVVSSTRTRDAILQGDVKEAARLLDRPYNLQGTVISGHRRGVGLGFPTANIKPDKELLPPRGVYAVKAEVNDQTYQGVLNIGYNPTFEDKKLSVELHILDFDEDIYGQPVNVLFIDRIRDEVKFAGPDALIAQIRQDVSRARELLSA
ncbi:MAG: bifunctional riboflavin kinase/FAD synthetase [Deltaproteobacteria bacterium]|nr:bifunctional riboflavin kinase/FAD synthetase [Deltaproteobacteria bacterium]